MHASRVGKESRCFLEQLFAATTLLCCGDLGMGKRQTRKWSNRGEGRAKGEGGLGPRVICKQEGKASDKCVCVHIARVRRSVGAASLGASSLGEGSGETDRWGQMGQINHCEARASTQGWPHRGKVMQPRIRWRVGAYCSWAGGGWGE